MNANSAREAGLRYIDDRQPGITRKRRGRHFAYYYPDGIRVRDRREVDRIRAIAIPPAYTHVWISPIANGHVQATARDVRHRKQYRYHKSATRQSITGSSHSGARFPRFERP